MRIIAKKTLRDFWEKYPDSQESLENWYCEATKSDWSTPQQVKDKFRNASIIADNRVVFNIKGNDYRLIVRINYPHHLIYIKFIGTHKQYDAVEASKV
jgi:mRNA interferase HigB